MDISTCNEAAGAPKVAKAEGAEKQIQIFQPNHYDHSTQLLLNAGIINDAPRTFHRPLVRTVLKGMQTGGLIKSTLRRGLEHQVFTLLRHLEETPSG